MRISYLITFIVCTFSMFLLSGCSCNSKKATDTGRAFLTSLYTCDFKTCDNLCTERGKEDVLWFASNLTEDDLSIISEDVKIKAQDCEIEGNFASILYSASNIIVCDSLETKGHLGDRQLTLNLKNIGGSWKVDHLEW